MPTTISVTNAGDSGAGTLRQAIADAVTGDTIIFDPAISTITLTSGEIIIYKNLTITGPSADKLTIGGNNNSRVFNIPTGVEVTIQRISIINGFHESLGGAILNFGTINITYSTLSNNNVNDYAYGDGGGAIYNQGTINISYSTLTNNVVHDVLKDRVGFGGAIWNSGTVAITNSTLSYNNALGGAINNSGTITIKNSTLSHNNLLAIRNKDGTVAIENSTLSYNSGPNGGAISNEDGTVTIENSMLSYNGGGDGGAIYNRGTVAAAAIENSTLSYNNAVAGGALSNSNGIVNITNSTLSDNKATGDTDFKIDGGAIFINGGTVNITNSTLSNNVGNIYGGAIFNGWFLNRKSIVNISFSTIAENQAPNGAGIYNNTSNSSIAFKNSIVANNDGPSFSGSGTFSAFGVNFDTDGTCPGFTQVKAVDLKLGPLALNQPGTTKTHALLKGSVAIDKAMDCTDLDGNAVTTDQRGVSRPQNTACDVGAYEIVSRQICVQEIIDLNQLDSFTVTCTPSNTPVVPATPPECNLSLYNVAFTTDPVGTISYSYDAQFKYAYLLQSGVTFEDFCTVLNQSRSLTFDTGNANIGYPIAFTISTSDSCDTSAITTTPTTVSGPVTFSFTLNNLTAQTIICIETTECR